MCEVKPDIKFGTDGWRGVISDDFTFENVRLVAQAIADHYNSLPSAPSRTVHAPSRTVLTVGVGYDARFLSDKYAQLVSEALAKNGINVVLSDRYVPTPTLSFAVKNRALDAGVMITASHNPGEYNGIKIKTAEGGAAGTDVTKEVERLIKEPLTRQDRQPGKIEKVDLTKEYVRFLRSYIDLKKFKNARFKVLVDAMHGSGGTFLAEVLKGTKIRLEFTRNDMNPSFEGLRPEPIPENLEATFKKLKKERFDLCLVLDGDADRIAAITGSGEFISPQKILGLLILHLIQDRKLNGGVVKTKVGTNLIDKITSKLGLRLYETPVGFKYISELMVKENILVGGEEAGGMGFKDYIPERDGSLAGLLLMEMMVYRKKSINQILKDMEKEFGRYYYERDRINLASAVASDLEPLKNIKKVLDKDVKRLDDSDGLKFILSDESWLMLRTSGTEPIIRIYAESKSLSTTKKMLDFGKKLILKNAV
jgi:phosphomannomutase